jgi:hypothetical protein
MITVPEYDDMVCALNEAAQAMDKAARLVFDAERELWARWSHAVEHASGQYLYTAQGEELFGRAYASDGRPLPPEVGVPPSCSRRHADRGWPHDQLVARMSMAWVELRNTRHALLEEFKRLCDGPDPEWVQKEEASGA